MAETIRDYVRRRLAKGYPVVRVWREVKEGFPHKSASWNYVLRLEREWLRDGRMNEQTISTSREG